MKLTVWTYEGPPHVGAMRVATAMKGLHYVLHAPQGDTYADLLFTMIERRNHRPPVTYTTFQARDLGADTATLFKTAAQDAVKRFASAGDHRRRVLHGGTDPGRSRWPGRGAGPVDPGDPAGAAVLSTQGEFRRGRDVFADRPPSGAALRTDRAADGEHPGRDRTGFRHRDDVEEITGLLSDMGIGVNVVAPLGATPADIARLPAAHANVLLYPETGESAARHLEKTYGQPWTKVTPIGVNATRAFVKEVAGMLGVSATVTNRGCACRGGAGLWTAPT